jgi:hypothetical protein
MNENLYALFESRFPADRGKPLLLLESGARGGRNPAPRFR